MTQYFTDDFADFDGGGTYPNFGDWTERYNDIGYSVSSGNLNAPAPAADDWNALTWNDIDGDSTRADVEILFIAQVSAVPRFLCTLRGAGADESHVGYSLYITGTTIRIFWTNGSDASAQIALTARTHATATDYWFRFRINGTGGTTSCYAKSWAGAIGDEPAWQINGATNTNGPSAAGWVGVAGYSLANTAIYKQIGVGTNGDSAPSAAVISATSIAFRRPFPQSILNF